MSRQNIPRQLPPIPQKQVPELPFGNSQMPFGGSQFVGSQFPFQAGQQSQMNNSNYQPIDQPYSEMEQVEEEVLKEPPNHDSGMTHTQFMSDDIIYNCFPLGERIGSRMKRLLKWEQARKTLVDELNKLEFDQLVHPFSLSTKDEQLINTDKTVLLNIINTSQLQMDTNIQHPFVKIHCVNMKTGCYLFKEKYEGLREQGNAVYNFETNCITNIVDDERVRETCELELLTAFSTNCCDMRMATNSRASWNEEITINMRADLFFKPETIILFEVLDFHPIFLQQKNSQYLDIDNFYRIAWGYLRPNGLCKLHMGQSKIQLFKYLFDTSKLRQVSRRESIPLVYFDFLWHDKQEYDAVLNIYLSTQIKPPFVDVFGKNFSENVYQIERGDEGARHKVKHSEIQEKVIEQKIEELTDIEKINLRRRRFLTDKEDHIPEKIGFKFASAPMGCYRLAFNRLGNYLACACTYKSSKTTIKVFDVEVGTQFATFKGHRNIIHDIQFSPNSQYLITSSSDFTVKLWQVPKSSSEIISEDESETMLIATLQHPSFTYSGIILVDNKMPVIATACFDSRMRIWQIDALQSLQIIDEPIQQEVISYDGISFDQFENLLTHRHPNCIVYDGSKCLYVGDSLGAIHYYDINLAGGTYIARRLSLIQIHEIIGNPINSITLMPPEQQDLLVHTRDNCIRIIDFKSSENKFVDSEVIIGTVINRFFGSLSLKIACKSVPSPKGDYILSGSEDGKPHLWSNLTQSIPTDTLQFNVIGPIADVAWNLAYHMIAIAGFGDEHPILVYVWEREGDINFIEAKKLQDEMLIRERQHDDIVFNVKPFQESAKQQGLFQPQQRFAQSSQFNQQQQQQSQLPFGQSQLPFGSQQQPFGQTQLPFGQSQPMPQQSQYQNSAQQYLPFEQTIQANGGGVPLNIPNTPYNLPFQ